LGFSDIYAVVCVLECTGSVQETGMDPTFRTAYMHPEKRYKAWFGLFHFKEVRSYFMKVSGVFETCGC